MKKIDKDQVDKPKVVAKKIKDKSLEKAKQLDKDVNKLKAKEYRDQKSADLENVDLVAGTTQVNTLVVDSDNIESVDSINDGTSQLPEENSESLVDVLVENDLNKVLETEQPLAEEPLAAVDHQPIFTRIGKGGAVSQSVVPMWNTGISTEAQSLPSTTPLVTGSLPGLISHTTTSFSQTSTNTNSSGPNEKVAITASQSNANVKENELIDTASGQISVSGETSSTSTASFTAENAKGTYGNLTIDSKTGAWVYHLDNSLTATDALTEGQHQNEQFVITVTDQFNNKVSTLVHIEVEGSNDLPTISGVHNASISERGAVDEVGGTLVAVDPDNNESAVWQAVNANSQYGSLQIDKDTGQWSYHLDNKSPSVLGLSGGQQITEQFTVSVTDSSGTSVNQQITVLINGTNEFPIINGAHTANLVENQGNNIASGQLTATDPDSGENLVWQAVSNQSQYGKFAIDSHTGLWRFELNNSSSTTQALKSGEIVSEHFLVQVTDSSGKPVQQEIVVSINGTEQTAKISGTSSKH